MKSPKVPIMFKGSEEKKEDKNTIPNLKNREIEKQE